MGASNVWPYTRHLFAWLAVQFACRSTQANHPLNTFRKMAIVPSLAWDLDMQVCPTLPETYATDPSARLEALAGAGLGPRRHSAGRCPGAVGGGAAAGSAGGTAPIQRLGGGFCSHSDAQNAKRKMTHKKNLSILPGRGNAFWGIPQERVDLLPESCGRARLEIAKRFP